MPDNQYDNFKRGIKNDITGMAYSAFAGIGLLTLILAIIIVFGVVFYKGNGFSIEVKVITGISLAGVIGMLVFSRRLGNLIYRWWLVLLIIIFMIAVAGIGGTIAYLLIKNAFTDFF